MSVAPRLILQRRDGLDEAALQLLGVAPGVRDELLVDHMGQSSFEAAQRFHGSLAGRELPPVVGTAFGVVPDLDGMSAAAGTGWPAWR